jgi:LacI family transcriptional regulator
MQTGPHPTAVICGNSYLAVGALLEAQSMGIRVPQDLSIVGYDDIDFMGELPVPITTVKVSGVEVGEHTARIMIAHLKGCNRETSFECSADIIVRASADVPPGFSVHRRREPEDSSVT